MNKKPLISVIVPIYNVEDYITDCLESILNQTYQNLEILLVDDGSTDHTAQRYAPFSSRDSRIKVFEKANGGASSARNLGLKFAQGDFISFVDSDDMIHPQFFEILLEHSSCFDIVFCNRFEGPHKKFKKWDSNAYCSVKSIDFSKIRLLEQIDSFKRPLVIVPWAKLYKRSLWLDLEFIEQKVHEDEFIIHHLIDRADKIRYVDIPLYYYRENRIGNVMGSLSEQKVIDYLDACLDRERFFLEKGMYSHAVRVYNEGRSYYIRKLLKLRIPHEEASLAKVWADPKLVWTTKIELLCKIMWRK